MLHGTRNKERGLLGGHKHTNLSHLVDVDAGEEGGAGGQTVEAELGADLAPDQQVGEVQGQARLVTVLRHHEVTHLDTRVDMENGDMCVVYCLLRRGWR